MRGREGEYIKGELVVWWGKNQDKGIGAHRIKKEF